MILNCFVLNILLGRERILKTRAAIDGPLNNSWINFSCCFDFFQVVCNFPKWRCGSQRAASSSSSSSFYYFFFFSSFSLCFHWTCFLLPSSFFFFALIFVVLDKLWILFFLCSGCCHFSLALSGSLWPHSLAPFSFSSQCFYWHRHLRPELHLTPATCNQINQSRPRHKAVDVEFHQSLIDGIKSQFVLMVTWKRRSLGQLNWLDQIGLNSVWFFMVHGNVVNSSQRAKRAAVNAIEWNLISVTCV